MIPPGLTSDSLMLELERCNLEEQITAKILKIVSIALEIPCGSIHFLFLLFTTASTHSTIECQNSNGIMILPLDKDY
jgi:hypothetical protein